MSKAKKTFILLLLLFCLPLCGCTKRVKLGGETFPADSQTVKSVVTAEELETLDSFEALSSADLSGSSCYEEIAAWAAAHPEVELRYTVSFPGGISAVNTDRSLDLSSLDGPALAEALPLLEWLPALENVNLGSGTLGPEALCSLVSAYPGTEFEYRFRLLGRNTSLDDSTLDLSAAGSRDMKELLAWLPAMTRLERVNLGLEADRAEPWAWEDIAALQAALPNAVFAYDFSLYGKNFSLTDTQMDLNHIAIDDEGALVLQVAKCMPGLSYLDMDFCGVSDEHMAQIRDALPNADVVWRIWFGTGYSVRTDVEMILASNPGRGGELTGENTRSLQYCTKVKYLDLGHNSYLNDVSFLSSMPDLEVLIIAMGNWSDISPLANCPKLEYAEIQTSALNDLSPLAGLKNLRHLNIGYCFALHDLSPIYELELDRLWIGCLTPIPAEQVEIYREKHPGCSINTSTIDPCAEGWRYTGANAWGSMDLDPRYELLHRQFRYSEKPYAYWDNDPLYYPHG